MAKSIKADKSWKIIREENDKKYNDFDIIINDNIKVHYHIISIDEVKDEKIEIVYNKTNNSSLPALNSFIKFSFFNITKDLCFFYMRLIYQLIFLLRFMKLYLIMYIIAIINLRDILKVIFKFLININIVKLQPFTFSLIIS